MELILLIGLSILMFVLVIGISLVYFITDPLRTHLVKQVVGYMGHGVAKTRDEAMSFLQNCRHLLLSTP